ncbi:MAG: LacI family DNA-binding transcriptional regulator [Anaerolineae bacterium]|nr:LacI family DNA-binding transcriptional regulator [Anaerolineae bacterium]
MSSEQQRSTVSRKSNPTIRDVARVAGVSVSTVSRVLNDKDDVAPETYEKVQQVIEELGYTSSLAAKGMRSRCTNVLGLVVPDVNDSFSIQVMRGVNQAIKKFNYDLIVYTGGNSRMSRWPIREQQYVSLLNGSITDGIIVVTPRATKFFTHYPLVAVDPHPEDAEFPAVIATNRMGALAVMEYLIGLGHRRIGFIGGRTDLQSALRRFQGYKDGLCQANLPLEQELIQPGDFTYECGYAAAQKLLNLPNPPTAIFAANDQSAFGVLKAAQEAGLSIPADLSLVGFDNTPEAAYIDVGLTTVDQFIDKMGYVATEMLVSLIQGNCPDSNLYKIPTRLIVRGSCCRAV